MRKGPDYDYDKRNVPCPIGFLETLYKHNIDYLIVENIQQA